jgi:hypothetical protein
MCEIKDDIWDKTIHELSILSSHNSFTGACQLFLPAKNKYLQNVLEQGFRGIELDVFGNNEDLTVTHNECLQKGFAFFDALVTIKTYAFATPLHKKLPLFIFIDDRISDLESLDLAAKYCREILGDRIVSEEKLYGKKLSELAGKICIISSRKFTPSLDWNRIVSTGLYSLNFNNFADTKTYKKTSEVLSRSYPSNYLFSKNSSYERFIGVVNFPSMNVNRFFGKRNGLICLIKSDK